MKQNKTTLIGKLRNSRIAIAVLGILVVIGFVSALWLINSSRKNNEENTVTSQKESYDNDSESEEDTGQDEDSPVDAEEDTEDISNSAEETSPLQNETTDNSQDGSTRSNEDSSEEETQQFITTSHDMVDITTGEKTGETIKVTHPVDLSVESDYEYTPPGDMPWTDQWSGYIDIKIQEATLNINYYYAALACDDRTIGAADEVIGTVNGKKIARFENIDFHDNSLLYYDYLAEDTGCEDGYMTFAYDSVIVRLTDVPKEKKAEIREIADEIVLSLKIE
jgi:hypothetical protein